MNPMPTVRQSLVERNTSETQIRLALRLTEGTPGSLTGSCGIGFLDHMLRAVCVHSGMDIELQMHGDLEVDCHHSAEDLGIAFGQPSGRRRGQEFPLPLRRVVRADGRESGPHRAGYLRPPLPCVRLCMEERARRRAGSVHDPRVLLRLLLFGGRDPAHDAAVRRNDHHKAEALFKSFARALQTASKLRTGGVLSTKGILC